MKKTLIVIGMFLGASLVYGAGALIPERKDSLNSTLEYHAKQIEKFEELKNGAKAEYKRVRCELYFIKRSLGEETQPESDTLCLPKE